MARLARPAYIRSYPPRYDEQRAASRLKQANMISLRLPTVGVALLGGLTLSGLANAANPACQWYVQTSAKQQQENMQRACGLKGPEWSTDTKVHAAYCESHAPEDWKSLAQKRQQALDGCAKKK